MPKELLDNLASSWGSVRKLVIFAVAIKNECEAYTSTDSHRSGKASGCRKNSNFFVHCCFRFHSAVLSVLLTAVFFSVHLSSANWGISFFTTGPKIVSTLFFVWANETVPFRSSGAPAPLSFSPGFACSRVSPLTTSNDLCLTA